jgi:hypothetical protein
LVKTIKAKLGGGVFQPELTRKNISKQFIPISEFGEVMTTSTQDIECLREKLDDMKRKSTRENSVLDEACRIVGHIALHFYEERIRTGTENKGEMKKKKREEMQRIESCGGNELFVALLDHPKGDVRADSMRVVERMGVCVMRGGHIPLTLVDDENWNRKGDTIIKISNWWETCTVEKEINEV